MSECSIVARGVGDLGSAARPHQVQQPVAQRSQWTLTSIPPYDQQMLEWTNGGAEREYAYGPAGGLPNTHVGAFTQTLMDEANQRGWIVTGSSSA